MRGGEDEGKMKGVEDEGKGRDEGRKVHQRYEKGKEGEQQNEVRERGNEREGT